MYTHFLSIFFFCQRFPTWLARLPLAMADQSMYRSVDVAYTILQGIVWSWIIELCCWEHSCWWASFLAFCFGGQPAIYTIHISNHLYTLCTYTTTYIFGGPRAMSKTRPPTTMVERSSWDANWVTLRRWMYELTPCELHRHCYSQMTTHFVFVAPWESSLSAFECD